MPTSRQPDSETTKVIKLIDRAAGPAPKRGRPKKNAMPALPLALLESMTDLEREHFHFFIAAIEELYPDLNKLDRLLVRLMACSYIALLRMEAAQMESGQLVTMSRQHPGVQLRAWMDLLSVTRKQRGKVDKDDEAAEFLKTFAS